MLDWFKNDLLHYLGLGFAFGAAALLLTQH